jgi:hypothetical protein
VSAAICAQGVASVGDAGPHEDEPRRGRPWHGRPWDADPLAEEWAETPINDLDAYQLVMCWRFSRHLKRFDVARAAMSRLEKLAQRPERRPR